MGSKESLPVFIGDDSREYLAYVVCEHSLRRHSSEPLEVVPIKHRALRHAGLFTRAWELDPKGQWFDKIDGKPFSSEFAYTRFLVPHICRRNGVGGWALFVDCDFLFLGDVAELFQHADPTKAVMVVKHHLEPRVGELKMDRMIQAAYPRKLWSSLILWNLDHEANLSVTPDFVNTATGSYLHGFGWLADEEIGELPEEWNWLVGLSPTTKAFHDLPKALHYTLGGPWLDTHTETPEDQPWLRELTLIRTNNSPRQHIVIA